MLDAGRRERAGYYAPCFRVGGWLQGNAQFHARRSRRHIHRRRSTWPPRFNPGERRRPCCASSVVMAGQMSLLDGPIAQCWGLTHALLNKEITFLVGPVMNAFIRAFRHIATMDVATGERRGIFPLDLLFDFHLISTRYLSSLTSFKTCKLYSTCTGSNPYLSLTGD